MNMPIDLLSEHDRKMLTAFIQEYGYNGIMVPQTIMDNFNFDHVFRFWNIEKSNYLLQLFGGNLMVSYPVQLEKPQALLMDELWKLYNTSPFVKAYNDWVYHNYERFYGIVEDCGKNPPIIYNKYDYGTQLDNLASPNLIINNSRGGCPDLYIPMPGDTFLAVPSSCKPMRILKKIADTYGIDGYEEFRIAHSQILNQKKLKGRLTLSIHPMDYFTMSMNSCNWTSCMRWPDGEYHQGTIEMMNSPSVIVAYLESDEPYYCLENTEYCWNNKKWRQLFIVDHDFISEVKAYPYQNDELATIVINTLRSLAEKNLGWEYYDIVSAESDTYCDDEGYLSFEDDIKRDWRIYLYTHKMYNDINTKRQILIAPTKNTTVIHNTTNDRENLVYCEFYYSGLSECMLCGALEDKRCIDTDESFCVECNNFIDRKLYW